MVIPESCADLYDYPVITFTYQVYKSQPSVSTEQTELKDYSNQVYNTPDADFLGYIVFEFPEKDYNYIEQGSAVLNEEELNDTIAQIMLYRKSYGVWEV